MSASRLFTSESVSEGHPDKIADQVSDAILDAIVAVDPNAKVAAETMIKTGFLVLAGEISIQPDTREVFFELEKIARQVVIDIGYDDSAKGFDGRNCGVLNALGPQSADIRQGVDRGDPRAQGAGDQGMMFGYATNETDVLMPAPITYAHRLVQKQASVRKSGELPWLLPDAKSQVTLVYEDGRPVGLDAVVLSTQHTSDVSNDDIRSGVIEKIIRPVLPAEWLSQVGDDKIHINPTGRFEIGGPEGDCGLTGRKIIVDTYGGMARHGGGAFSGKDPSKVDRSAAYATRYVAKNIVAAGLAERCEVQVSYAIGVARPTSVAVDTFGTGRIPDDQIIRLIDEHFDLTPYGIRETLNLLQPIYRQTAAYGHFGREDAGLPWERTDKAEALRGAAAA